MQQARPPLGLGESHEPASSQNEPRYLVAYRLLLVETVTVRVIRGEHVLKDPSETSALPG